MNTQEKKELKLRLRKEKHQATKKQKLQGATANAPSPVGNNSDNSDDPLLHLHQVPSGLYKRYHQLRLSTPALEEELADLRGDRDGVPPVMMSPPMAHEAFRAGVLKATDSDAYLDTMSHFVLDDDLASRWAVALKKNMENAEQVRSKEAIRPMPYQLLPEVWTRLRPDFLSDLALNTETASSKVSVEDVNNDDQGMQKKESNSVWSFITVRRRLEQTDDDTAIVVSMLHHFSNLHVSCGAKFGCDFLLYDGRRDQRHAFAGLRVMERSSSQLPLPSTYDLTGYVRCLNTAGKLALLATVERGKSGARVAFVDLALEKVVWATSQKRGRSREAKPARREMRKNPSKHR
jgi:tRNA splicing endonuclease